MNTYERFLSSLLSEFKRRAQPLIRSLWADLIEVTEATDEPSLSAAREQALRRIRILGRAARAANAGQVQSRNQALELRLRALMPAPAAARPELSHEGLYETMRELAGAQCSIDGEAPVPENTNQPTEALLVESCAD
jgi:hypothetical protein